jgi:hypothetical protein
MFLIIVKMIFYAIKMYLYSKNIFLCFAIIIENSLQEAWIKGYNASVVDYR